MANFLQNDKEILDVTNDSKYNGRVDILDIKPQQKYKMINQMNNGNRLYKNEAIKSIQSESPLSRVYFSRENINLLQNLIRYNVWIKSQKQFQIGRQSDLQLKIIMRSIYFQYSKNQSDNITQQIERLNDIVINDCVPRIISNVKQYLKYKQDVSQLRVPMDRPQYLSNAGTKTLMPNPFI